MNPLMRPSRQVFDFSGRATRTEYGLFYLSGFAAYFVLGLLPITMFDFRGRPAEQGTVAMLIIAVMVLLSLTLVIAFVAAARSWRSAHQNICLPSFH